MERIGGENEGERTSVVEVTAASVVGTVIVATYLLFRSGAYRPIAAYMMALALITIVALFLGPETFRRQMSEGEVGGEKVGPRTATSA